MYGAEIEKVRVLCEAEIRVIPEEFGDVLIQSYREGNGCMIEWAARTDWGTHDPMVWKE